MTIKILTNTTSTFLHYIAKLSNEAQGRSRQGYSKLSILVKWETVSTVRVGFQSLFVMFLSVKEPPGRDAVQDDDLSCPNSGNDG